MGPGGAQLSASLVWSVSSSPRGFLFEYSTEMIFQQLAKIWGYYFRGNITGWKLNFFCITTPCAGIDQTLNIYILGNTSYNAWTRTTPPRTLNNTSAASRLNIHDGEKKVFYRALSHSCSVIVGWNIYWCDKKPTCLRINLSSTCCWWF